MSERIYLGLGSNSGDSRQILKAAIHDLGTRLVETKPSSLWFSAPRYVVDQPPFYNLVVEAKGSLSPEELLDFTSSIETKFGRDRTKERSKGPRSLDIDILLIGNRIVDSPRLVIPHPGMEERKFVLLPLVELNRDLQNPRTGRAYLASLADLGPQGIYLDSPGDYDRLRF
ncbi:MAG TPA: 2-amino-4-hydroxy-6-hydroxymethyldihydropteridine diphosphokinase [Rectinemataceae bacterium]|nr:2-amino-4-hydroxy-6-hydroxymethyldihydropteridine diphosphokinase [Rectinemataceae bacterium]